MEYQNYTNDLYRVDVVYDTVIRNAKAFIDAGGFAQWNMTVFDPQLHQIREAMHLQLITILHLEVGKVMQDRYLTKTIM